ncbi:MerR family transcriptional regulator [Bombilactobacillus bombi]|uniref:MerR family transcriptional regulator n=1 Tax=Bombilactobacillus bombi TaxID=1303590 RepID=UPI0015E627F1|nr:MerR family transcriptional regulator [Bombilactobacillus bombi]MBA1434488.1 MerR family transcriptional regulator [Bombilactobacillus bombi]
MYTIGQISQKFNLPISTIRYYDKEGLFPDLARKAGIRYFSEKEVEALRVIECLKQSGLSIADIKQFMQWSKQGRQTYQLRKELFENQKQVVQAKIKQLNQVLNMINYKCWYYDEALKLGDEDQVLKMVPHCLPDDIKVSYSQSH